MKKLLFGLCLLFVSFMSVSFADFQSDMNSCRNSKDYLTCITKVQKKHQVSKKKACTMKNGHYMQPLEAKRPKEIVKVDRFFKYNDKILYPVEVSSGGNRAETMSPYYFIYDCAKKKTSDKTSSFATMNRLGVTPLQSSGNLLLVQNNTYEGGDKTNYRIININKLSFERVNINIFKGFARRKDLVKKELKDLFITTSDKQISAGSNTKVEGGDFEPYWSDIELSFPQNGYDGSREVSDTDKNFNGTISFRTATSTEDKTTVHYLGKSKINLLTKTITVE